jgi:NADPH:quinone reductase
MLAAAQKTLIGYLSEGAIQPTIAKVFPLSDAADAVRHLIEDRPFGRVLMRVAIDGGIERASVV